MKNKGNSYLMNDVKMNKFLRKCILALSLGFLSFSTLRTLAEDSREIGKVSYDFNAFTPNDKIVAETFEDPDFKNVSCYISRSVLGGVEGTLGVAENTASASISCTQVGPVDLSQIKKSESGEKVFSERRSLLLKHLNVDRFADFEKGVLIYMLYTRKLTTGSPQSSISAVKIKD
ncbi:MAG: CreA family protein [Bdellovibrionales bacterium]|nr:CreA family protein [Bdellovibrionales bacterium]